MTVALQILLVWLVLQAAVTDLAIRRIPNVLVLAGLAIALALHWRAGPAGLLLSTWLAGIVTGFFLFLPLYLLRGMAAGDVKLMAMTGAFVGPALALRIALLTCLIGGVMAVVIVIHNGRWRILCRNLVAMLTPLLVSLGGVPQTRVALPRDASAGGIPYGVAIALGTVCVVVQPHL
ncbi:prepilin peptidase [Pseudoduganella plicata]|uniref:Pilus assembly-related outer membrane protein n=1 Tax=Pseudoduganella plicata TaxID=321984 RepID=A0A4P7BGE6_9BURK|nr:prepilin peptidase [Pseudoduganella plicata]QBQ37794.1 prepilin peptidase [Pseudoduganella plicata]GGY93146.1 pilus assembly-related outer membrane protein [Pseudoduganella plicata]